MNHHAAAAPGCLDPDIERLDREALGQLQLDRLRESVYRAARGIAHYRERFARTGVGVESLRRLEDLSRFPLTTKDDLRRAYPFGWFAVDRREVVRVHASSGTTGTPTVVGYTASDVRTWAEIMARALYCAGVRPGDVLHNSHGYGLFTGGLGVHYGAERLGCMVVPVSGGNTEKQVMLLADFAADVIVGTPSYIVHIAEVAARMGVDLASGPLRVGMFGGEPWCEQMRGELERALGLAAHDLYGMCELMGPGVACECEARDGLHGWEDHFLFEIIDPDSGEPLPRGEYGELVITTLTREAMPLVRYRTRDMTRLDDAPCRCGRTHLRLAKVAGRSDDMLIIRGVNVYPSQIEAALVSHGGISPNYQLRVEREGALDTLTVCVERAAGAEFPAEGLPRSLRRHIKSLVGVTCEVELAPCGALPRSSGKAARVVDLRKPTGGNPMSPGASR